MEKQVKIMFAAAPNAIPVEAVLTMEAPEDLPDGTVGYMLVKTADGVDWVAVPVELPTEGTTGHVLTKTEDGVDWVAGPVELPTEGTTGHVLTKTESGSGYDWAAVPVELPAEGTTGHVLTKTEGGYEWAAIPAVEHPIPAIPETDGEYKLVITDGVATWVSLT